MEASKILLEELKRLKDVMPDMDEYLPTSATHQVWLQAAYSKLAQWSPHHAGQFKRSSDMLILHATRPIYVLEMMEIFDQALSELESAE